MWVKLNNPCWYLKKTNLILHSKEVTKMTKELKKYKTDVPSTRLIDDLFYWSPSAFELWVGRWIFSRFWI